MPPLHRIWNSQEGNHDRQYQDQTMVSEESNLFENAIYQKNTYQGSDTQDVCHFVGDNVEPEIGVRVEQVLNVGSIEPHGSIQRQVIPVEILGTRGSKDSSRTIDIHFEGCDVDIVEGLGDVVSPNLALRFVVTKEGAEVWCDGGLPGDD